MDSAFDVLAEGWGMVAVRPPMASSALVRAGAAGGAEGMGHGLARLFGQASLAWRLDAASGQAHSGDVT
jgi:hypothetical protein